jgi:hypothetical protein
MAYRAGMGGGRPKGLRLAVQTREAIAEGQRRAWSTRSRKPKPRGKRAVLELARLIAAQTKDARTYRIKTGPLFSDWYQVIDGREVHRPRRTTEKDFDERGRTLSRAGI